MYKHILIDTERNMLICDPASCGKGELVEIHERDDATPAQITGKILRKIADPNIFQLHISYDDDQPVEEKKMYTLGEKCSLRILYRNKSGTYRRKCSKEEKVIVNLEKGQNFKETKVCKAKTGSVRKSRRSRKT